MTNPLPPKTPSIVAALLNQPNALSRIPMPPANAPRVPLPMPQPPQLSADISRMSGAGSGSGKFWHITDANGAVTGMIHKPATPFSSWNIIPYVNGQLDQSNAISFSSKAKAEQYLGVVLP